MLPDYLVKISGTRNCHVHWMSETTWHESIKLSWQIQTFKNSPWNSNVWRCKHYLINWQKYFHSDHTAQHTEWLIIWICIIIITGNCFCWQPSTCIPPSWLQFCQMFIDLKSFSSGRLSNKFVKIDNFTTPQMCSYTTLWFNVNHDISLRMSIVLGHWCSAR